MKYENKTIKTASKFISLLLRHKPETIGLVLNEAGWASIEDLINLSAQNSNVSLDKDLILHIVKSNDKQRFSISDDGQCIRANQGHSLTVELNLQPRQPPKILFHGTARRFLDNIYKKGLLKLSRQHVHLSDNVATAISVGQRHGKAVVLKIDAQNMSCDGYQFYLSENGVWLTDHVPVKFFCAEG